MNEDLIKKCFQPKRYRMISWLPVQYQPRNPCQYNHQDGVNFELPGKDKGGTKDQETFVIDEVFFVHQH